MTAAKKKSSSKVKKVWRIFHFLERYEMPEDMRKCRVTALEFTRDFVGSGGGDEAVGYQYQFSMLSNGDGAEYSKYYGVYRQLVNMAAKRSRAYRGYLIDAKNQPLTDGQLGKVLNYETKDMKKILRKLASVELLERVDLPEFDLSVNRLPPKKFNNNEQKKSRQKTSGRKRAEKSARKRTPLKETTNDKNKKKKGSNNINSKDKSSKKKNSNGNDKRNRDNFNALKDQTKGQTTTSPTTTPPFMPRASDAGGSVIRFATPPGSAKRNQPQRVGDIAKEIIHRYDPDAKEFSIAIYHALKLSLDPNGCQIRRELGCFAKAWHKTKSSGIPPPELNKLWDRAVDIASKIAKKHPKYPNPSKVWRGTFNKLIASKLSKRQCKVM